MFSLVVKTQVLVAAASKIFVLVPILIELGTNIYVALVYSVFAFFIQPVNVTQG